MVPAIVHAKVTFPCIVNCHFTKESPGWGGLDMAGTSQYKMCQLLGFGNVPNFLPQIVVPR